MCPRPISSSTGSPFGQAGRSLSRCGGSRRSGHEELVDAVQALWATGVHECRMAAVELLVEEVGLPTVDDVPLIERLLRESKTWALVDGLAATVVGGLDERVGIGETLDRWASDDDFWLRRSALLAHLKRLRVGDEQATARFLLFADGMLDESEFFVRKAIGWCLRELGKSRPDLVAEWLAPRTHRASGVTMREAVKRIDPADADRLMSAYRERRSAG
ncbi:MAG TPA: DNA alkylation repair protein [Acidimicrobiia bacterium]|nr:DNA alkylation repair protein [Acidimicrobiia bacterium]